MWVLSVLGVAAATWLGGAHALESDIKSMSNFIQLRTHSLVQPYLDSDLQSRWWDFGGDTVIRTDKHIRLTSDRPSQSGWIYSRVPLTATNWEVELEFDINGQGNLFGDGFAMWVTKDRAQQGSVFGNKDKFDGLAIFFDTYKNNRPGVVFPYVMAMLGDGQTAYDQAHDGKANELAGCSARGLRNANTPTKARITYFAEKSLTVELMYKKEDEWTPCFDVPNVKLPGVAYLGFSAETGELSDNHDIVKVETKSLYQPSGAAGTPKDYSKSAYKPNQHAQKEGGGWAWFLLKFVLFGLGLTAAYVAFTVFRASRRRDRF